MRSIRFEANELSASGVFFSIFFFFSLFLSLSLSFYLSLSLAATENRPEDRSIPSRMLNRRNNISNLLNL